MNSLFRKGFGMFKAKKINVYLDDEWILCDVKNNTTNENLIKNTKNSINRKNISQNFDTHICSHSNIQTIPYVSNNKITKNIQKPLMAPMTDNNPSLISLCYDVFMNLVEEIDLLKVIFMFDDIELPSIGV